MTTRGHHGLLLNGGSAPPPPAGWVYATTSFPSGNPQTVDVPAGAVGDLMMVFITGQQNSITVSGWSSFSPSSGAYWLAGAWRIADSAGATTISVNRGATDAGVAVVIRIPAADHDGSTAPYCRNQTSFSSSNSINPPDATPGWGTVPKLAIAVAGIASGSDYSGSMGYPLPDNHIYMRRASAMQLAICSGETTDATVDPTAFSWSGITAAAGALTIVVRK